MNAVTPTARGCTVDEGLADVENIHLSSHVTSPGVPQTLLAFPEPSRSALR